MNTEIMYLEKPARKWDEGYPLGNGRLGAMVMGKVREETIFLNEETLCFGPPRRRENPDAKEHIPEIRRLLMEGHVEQAAFLAKMALTSAPKYNNPYQPLGDLRLCFLNHSGKPENYRRSLDLSRAVAKVEYRMNGIRFEREHFVSREYQVLAVRIRSLGAAAVTMSANISRKPFEEYSGLLDECTAGIWGENGAGGMRYAGGVTIDSPLAKTMGDFVYAENAEELVVYLAGGTDYEDCLAGRRDAFEGAVRRLTENVLERLERAKKAGYDTIKKRHTEDYRKLYGAFDLTLSQTRGAADKATDAIIETVRQEERRAAGGVEEQDGEAAAAAQAALTVQLVRYARYLMISSSCGCLLPANLQGLWNGAYEPPWQCQYTININTQMNYWFVEKAGLSDCHLPLFSLLKLLSRDGKITAEKLYGCRGFVAHHNTNVWGCAAPEGIFDSSPYWVMGGAWLCLHLYTHYRYTKDRAFLENEAMPLMREAIRFFEDYLYELPDGTLVTGPVVSPENTYRSGTGETGALCMGPTMDMSILRNLLDDYLEGMEELSIRDEADRALLTYMRNRLAPLKIGRDGRIQEWYQEFEETEPGHRHISHLFGLHPGYEITRETPELLEAARKTLEARLAGGGGHTGWSRAWLACFYARLGDGKALETHIRRLLSGCIQDNLLDVHPPFQIDGNFGIAEAILEGLVWNHKGVVRLLPALPETMASGALRGMCLEGGVRLDMKWEAGRVTEAVFAARSAQTITVYVNGKKETLNLEPGRAAAVRAAKRGTDESYSSAQVCAHAAQTVRT